MLNANMGAGHTGLFVWQRRLFVCRVLRVAPLLDQGKTAISGAVSFVTEGDPNDSGYQSAVALKPPSETGICETEVSALVLHGNECLASVLPLNLDSL